MSNVHHLPTAAPPSVIPAYTWGAFPDAKNTRVIWRGDEAVGFVSVMPEIPFADELVDKIPALFAEHERALRDGR